MYLVSTDNKFSFDGMNRNTIIPPRFVRLIYLAITVAIILGIVGATKVFSPASTSDISTGRSLQKASTIIYLVVFLILCAFEVLIFLNLQHVLNVERKLVFAVALALPFTLIRLIYSLIAVFGHSKYFSLFTPDVWTSAFMQVLMEMIVAVLLIVAGLLTPPVEKKQGTLQAYDMEQGQQVHK